MTRFGRRELLLGGLAATGFSIPSLGMLSAPRSLRVDGSEPMIAQGGPGAADVTQFYRAADGGDFAPALSRALETAARVRFPSRASPYPIRSQIRQTLLQDSVIDFNGQELVFSGEGRLELVSQSPVAGRKLAADAARYARRIELDNVVGLQRGDLLLLYTSIKPSPDEWTDTKQDVVKLDGLSGRAVQLLDGLNFHYARSDFVRNAEIRAFRPVSLTLLGPRFTLASADRGAESRVQAVMMHLEGLENVLIRQPVLRGAYPFSRRENIYRVGIQFYYCRNWRVEDASYEALSYPVGVYGGTRYGTELNVASVYCHHGHADLGGWSSDYRVTGIRASRNWMTVSTHPCFRAHVADFQIPDDFGMINMRCIGGSLRNGSVRNTGPYETPQFQSVRLAEDYRYLYDDAEFVVDSVSCDLPNWEPWRRAFFRHGRKVTIRRSPRFSATEV